MTKNVNGLINNPYLSEEFIRKCWKNSDEKFVELSVGDDIKLEDILLGYVTRGSKCFIVLRENGKELSEEQFDKYIKQHLEKIESILLYNIHKLQSLTPVNGLASLPFLKADFLRWDFVQKVKFTKMEKYAVDRNLEILFSILQGKKVL